MGTTYSIIYIDSTQTNYKKEIDSVLVDVNNSLSTYISTSTISRFNQCDSTSEVDEHFVTVFKKAKEVYKTTNGAFNPAVMPLVNYWGFGYDKSNVSRDSFKVDSLLLLTSFGSVKLIEKEGIFFALKHLSKFQLDFSAIAKGYGVDVVGGYLESKDVNNYMVEIGGEVLCKGRNENNQAWRIGIDQPKESSLKRNLQAIVELENAALATSGNYRNFYEKDGKKYVHTINPKTGYPEISNLLSVSILSDDCMTADAYATAFMVMGVDSAKAFINRSKSSSIECYLIYSNDQSQLEDFMSEGLKQILSKPETNH